MTHLHPSLEGHTLSETDEPIIRAVMCEGNLTPCPLGRRHQHCDKWHVDTDCDDPRVVEWYLKQQVPS